MAKMRFAKEYARLGEKQRSVPLSQAKLESATRPW